MSELSCPPVLFLVFNRPAVTAQVFEQVRKARPSRLYVAADGPRAGRDGEAGRCAEVRAIATAVDWPCELHTRLREHNLGCRRAVPDAISWFFRHESEGIVLEDDCWPAPDFFRFCAWALAHWRDDERVMHIGATVVLPNPQPVFASRLVPITGWASWRRAWAHYDDSMSRLAELERLPLTQWYGRRAADVRRAITRIHRDDVDAWGARWVLTVLARQGLAVLPGVNLISNLGYGADATHTVADSHLARRPTAALPRELHAPAALAADAAYDEAYLHHLDGSRGLVRRAAARILQAARALRHRA